MSIYNMLYIPLKKKKVLSYHGIMRCCLVGLVIYILLCLFILIKDKVKTWSRNDRNDSKRTNAMIGENNNLHRKLFENKFTIYHNDKKMISNELGFRLNESNNAGDKRVPVAHPQGIHPDSNVVMKSNHSSLRKSRGRPPDPLKPAGPACQPVRLSGRKLPLVALATSTGSGTTWARHLFQQVTGEA